MAVENGAGRRRAAASVRQKEDENFAARETRQVFLFLLSGLPK